MARQDNFKGIKRYCIMCTEEIPTERRSDSVTCSVGCSRERERFTRSRIDQTKCRYCNHPSTPEERQRYSRWRAWERKHGPFGMEASNGSQQKNSTEQTESESSSGSDSESILDSRDSAEG